VSGQDPAKHLVVSAVLRRDDQFLLCHRHPARRWYPDTWDLPGGHVEIGEVPHDALVRELREELGIVVAAPMEPIAHIQGADFRNDIWLVDAWTGEPANLAPEEHDELRWFDPDHVSELRLADTRIITLLNAARR